MGNEEHRERSTQSLEHQPIKASEPEYCLQTDSSLLSHHPSSIFQVLPSLLGCSSFTLPALTTTCCKTRLYPLPYAFHPHTSARYAPPPSSFFLSFLTLLLILYRSLSIAFVILVNLLSPSSPFKRHSPLLPPPFSSLFSSCGSLEVVFVRLWTLGVYAASFPHVLPLCHLHFSSRSPLIIFRFHVLPSLFSILCFSVRDQSPRNPSSRCW